MPGLREDRFFYTTPIVFQKTFYNSRFLKLYYQTERCPEKSTVINALKQLANTVNCSKVISRVNKISDDYDAIDSQIYKSDQL